jgi:hypothetical protein
MNTELSNRCRAIKRRASMLIWPHEAAFKCNKRPAARQAWRLANYVQNRIIIQESRSTK